MPPRSNSGHPFFQPRSLARGWWRERAPTWGVRAVSCWGVSWSLVGLPAAIGLGATDNVPGLALCWTVAVALSALVWTWWEDRSLHRDRPDGAAPLWSLALVVAAWQARAGTFDGPSSWSVDWLETSAGLACVGVWAPVNGGWQRIDRCAWTGLPDLLPWSHGHVLPRSKTVPWRIRRWAVECPPPSAHAVLQAHNALVREGADGRIRPVLA
jgi:hypothetical protein